MNTKGVEDGISDGSEQQVLPEQEFSVTNYCEACGREGCRTTKFDNSNICVECKKILKSKGIL